MDSTTMKGTVQGYFDRAFDEMTDKELETPLANSGLGVKAKLAPNRADQVRRLQVHGPHQGVRGQEQPRVRRGRQDRLRRRGLRASGRSLPL